MDEEMMNVDNPDVVQPEGGASEETAAPQSSDNSDNSEAAAPKAVDVDAMTDEEFAEYIQSAQNGLIDEQPQVNEPTAENQAENDGIAEPEAKPFKQFRTQQEYQNEIDRIVSKRYNDIVKKNKDNLDLLEKLKIEARNFYGDATDDVEAVKALLGDLTNQNAEKRGVEAAEYSRQTQDAQDARRYRQQQREQEDKQKQIEAIQRRWQEGSEDLRRIVPSFDFDKAMENKKFYDAIMSGASVQTAYMMVNKPKADKPKRQVINQVGMQSGVSGKSEVNVAKLPSSDFMAYIENIMNNG